MFYSDSIPHVPNGDYNQSHVLRLISNITSYLMTNFPHVAVYPLLGNHDVWPSNQQPDDASDQYYVDMLEKTGWSHLLTTSEVDSFEKGYCLAVKQFCCVL